MRNGNADLVARYEDLLLDTANIDTIDLSAPIAQEAARLRATYNLRTPEVTATLEQSLQDVWSSKVSPPTGADQTAQAMQAILDQPR